MLLANISYFLKWLAFIPNLPSEFWQYFRQQSISYIKALMLTVE